MDSYKPRKKTAQLVTGGGGQQTPMLKAPMAFARIQRLVCRLFPAPTPNSFDAIVVSYGGSGTTFLIDFLRARMTTNANNSLDDGIKHANSPNHVILQSKSIGRALYIYATPPQAVLSLFRRNFQVHMIPKLTSGQHRNRREYARHVNASLRDIDLEGFLRAGEDLFGIHAHWRAWTTEPVSFPVLYLRYEALYEHLPEIFDFLNIPRQELASFPPKRARHSVMEQLPLEQRDMMDAIYGTLAREMDAMPTLFRRDPEVQC